MQRASYSLGSHIGANPQTFEPVSDPYLATFLEPQKKGTNRRLAFLRSTQDKAGREAFDADAGYGALLRGESARRSARRLQLCWRVALLSGVPVCLCAAGLNFTVASNWKKAAQQSIFGKDASGGQGQHSSPGRDDPLVAGRDLQEYEEEMEAMWRAPTGGKPVKHAPRLLARVLMQRSHCQIPTRRPPSEACSG